MTEYRKNTKPWDTRIKQLFPKRNSSMKVWTSITDISNILNQLIKSPVQNHLFYPTGGGEDLKLVRPSLGELGCLELIAGTTSIVKPKSLSFIQIDEKNELSYFLLETDLLTPSGVYPDPPLLDFEEVTELNSGEYVERFVADIGCYNGYDIDNYRTLTRHFHGSFVIFAKFSPYCHLRGDYDGYNALHNKMRAQEFKKFVSSLS